MSNNGVIARSSRNSSGTRSATAAIESPDHSLLFLFREALLCHSKSWSAAQRTLDAAARMARRTEELVFSSSGRRGHSQPRRQGRAAWAFANILTERLTDIFTEQ